jgi:hypothetical protein
MLFDLIGAIVLTASAAIVIGALAATSPDGPAARIGVAATLAGWFAAIVLLAGADAFDPVRGIGAPGIGAVVLLPILALGYAALRPGAVRRAWLAIPLPLLIGVNAVRVLGVLFVLLYADGRLPAPFAPSAGWGDIAIGLTALPVAALAVRRPEGWRVAALGWNALGLLDLVTAIGLGIASSPGTPLRLFFEEPGTALMSGLPWILIPGFLVPLLVLTHLAVFARLLTGEARSGHVAARAF